MYRVQHLFNVVYAVREMRHALRQTPLFEVLRLVYPEVSAPRRADASVLSKGRY